MENFYFKLQSSFKMSTNNIYLKQKKQKMFCIYRFKNYLLHFFSIIKQFILTLDAKLKILLPITFNSKFLLYFQMMF